MQLYLAIGLPMCTIVASLIISLFQISGVREDVREIRNDIKRLTGKFEEIDNRLSIIQERIK
ncbi:MAG: hypothetical protein JO099_16565 [Acidobacteriia bacterium]|nr:hypothetical protein [Terriglobia bacterium]